MNGEFHGAPPADSIPLSEAIQRFVPEELWAAHRAALEAPKNLPKRPSWFDMSPREWELAKARYRALTSALPPRPDPRRLFADICANLIEQLASGALEAYGQDDPPFGPWRRIPMAACRQLRIGKLGTDQGRIGERLVSGIHIRQFVPGGLIPTGMPGRPRKGADIISAEFERRGQAGLVLPSLAAEARALQEWYRETHPTQTCPKVESIENRIRHAYNLNKAERSSPTNL